MFDWFWEFLYSLLKSILYLIDFVMEFAKKLVGISAAKIGGEDADLLKHFMLSEPILDAFKLVSIIGIVLLFLFTIFSVVRSVAKLGEGKTPMGVCLDGAKAILYFLMVPAIMIIGGAFVSAIMTSVYNATTGGGCSLGGSMFTIFADEAYDGDANKATIMEYFRKGDPNSNYYYYKSAHVDTYFNFKDINYFLGYVSSFLVLSMLVKSLMSFVERIVSLVLLFIVAPLSVSSTVLDDGARFKLWRDEVINKFLIAYGSIISINIFVLLVEVIYSDNIEFFTSSFFNSLAKLMFVIGGASACKMGAIMIGNLINHGAGSQYASDQHHMGQPFGALAGMGRRMLGGLGHGLTHNPISNNIKKDVSAAWNRSGDARRAVKADAAKNRYTSEQSQKFNDKLARGVSERRLRNDWRVGLSQGEYHKNGGGKTIGEILKGSSGSVGNGSGGNSDAHRDNAVNKQSADTIRSALQSGKKNGDK